MLKLFFNKEGMIVYALELLGVLLLGLFLWKGHWLEWSLVHRSVFVLFVTLYLFLRWSAWRPWYPRTAGEKYLGIEMHFKKVMVPTAYIVGITGGWLIGGGSLYLLYVVAILLLVITHVTVILLYCYWKDHDPAPVNAFSRPRLL